MSMSFPGFTCSRCDFSGSGLIGVGPRHYQIEEESGGDVAAHAPVEATLGWCHECEGIAHLEVLPSEESVALLAGALSDLQERIMEARAIHGEGTEDALGIDDDAVDDLAGQLNDERQRLALLRNRVSGPRCLRCSSEQVSAFPPLPKLQGTWNDPGPPSPIGFKHPGCGGDLQRAYSATYIAIIQPERFYSPEGFGLNLAKPAGASATTRPMVDLADDDDDGGIDQLPDYFGPPRTPVEACLRTIKGNFRRNMVRDSLGEDPLESVPPAWRAHSLTENLKKHLLAKSPAAVGGEDLPDLDDGEVEIARLTYVGSVHGEVVSLRARREGGAGVIHLRLVDEFDTEFELEQDAISRSLRPEEVVDVFCHAEPCPLDVDVDWSFSSFFYVDLDELA